MRRLASALASLCLLLILAVTGACRDDITPEKEMKEVPSYISLEVSVPRTTSGGTPAGGEEGDGLEEGEERESTISKITLLIYKRPADGNGINTDSVTAANTKVRAFCWQVNLVNPDKDSNDILKTYTTGARPLPGELAFGAYQLLVVGNADLTAQLDNRSLAYVRNYIVNREPFDRNDISSGNTEYNPSKYTDFILSSREPVDLVVGNAEGHNGSGSQFNPFRPSGNIMLERLAARIDFVPDDNGTRWNAADSTYDYPVYDSLNNVVATFKLKYCCPFNLTQQQYLFKHTTTLKDTTTVNYCGRETSEVFNGLRFGTNYVLDPQTFSTNYEEMVGSFFYPNLYHRLLTENIVALKSRFPVKPYDQLSGPDNNGRRYYILGYSAENTHTYKKLSSKTFPYSAYISGIRIFGRYVRKGQSVAEGTDVPFDWYIRHSAPDGKADISRPLTFALVRNNIYRIYISKIRSVGSNFHVQFMVNVVPWQRYEHAEIPM